MPKKGITKLPISATVDRKVAKELEDFCIKNRGIKKSTIIEEALKKFLDKEKNAINSKRN